MAPDYSWFQYLTQISYAPTTYHNKMSSGSKTEGGEL